MTLSPGCTVHIPDTGPPHDKGKSHLFVVLTEPCEKGMALLVPICTIRGKFDPACKVAPGEHGFIEDESYVAYYYMNQYKVAVLEKQISDGAIYPDEAVKADLLKRICDGVALSSHAPPVEKKYYKSRLAEGTKEK